MAIIPANAAVVRVRYTQFDHGEQISFPHVESRMLSWCKSGRGTVRVNGELFSVQTDDYMFAPWGHAIEYRADEEEPFLLGSVHIVPDHDTLHPIEFWISHGPGDRLANCPWRRNAPLPELDRVVTGNFSWNAALGHLAEFTVQRLLYAEMDEATSRMLARLILQEVYRSLEVMGPRTHDMPGDLQRIRRYIVDHLARRLGLRELSEFSGLSRATIGRLFKRHLKCTPGEWVLQRRVEQAQHLLCTTRLPVAQVGARVGIDDPYYFSKIFKRNCGLAPLAYRKSRSLL